MLTGEVSARLTSESLVSSGFAVYRNVWPASPDRVIALFETGGFAPEVFFGGVLDQPGLQVRVRGLANDSDAPRTQVEVIYQAMVGWGAFTASGVRYLGFRALQAPFLMGRDATGRVEWAVNMLALKAQSPTA